MKTLDPATTALLLIDVINDFEFDGREKLLTHAVPAAANIARLKRRMRAAGVPVIYVNDNFGRWQADFRDLIDLCLDPGCAGHAVAAALVPTREDYYILKPRHSGFYSTSLQVLLGCLGTKTLIIAGFAGDICVLYTANDAYMRDYELIIAADCIASESREGNATALKHMASRLKAKVKKSASIC